MKRNLIVLTGVVALIALLSYLFPREPVLVVPSIEPLSDASDADRPTPSEIPSTIVFQNSGDDLPELDAGEKHFNCRPGDFIDEPGVGEGNYDASMAEQRDRYHRISDQLSVSADAEHVLLAGLLGSGDGSRFDLARLRRAVEMNPDDARFHWHLLQACTRMSAANGCDPRGIEAPAIAAGGRSAALWAQIAIGRAARDDEAGALDALRNANGAPNFDSYYVDDVKMIERGLASATDQSFNERMTEAFGIAVTLHSVGGDVYLACSNPVETSAEWQDLCLQLAYRLEKDGQTILDKALGLGIQKTIFELTGDDTKLEDAERRYREFQEEMMQGWGEDVSVVLMFDERVMAEFVDELAAHGEMAAFEFARAETERLKELPGYDPCKMAPIRVRQAIPAPSGAARPEN
jgi:hypothetical protein